MSLRTRSIRARLTVAMSALTAATIIVSAILGVVLLSRFLTERVETQLDNASTRVAGALDVTGGTDVTAEMLVNFLANGQAVVVESRGEVVGIAGVSPDDANTLVRSVDSDRPERVKGRFLAVRVAVESDTLRYVVNGTTYPVDHIVIAADTSDNTATIRNVVVTSAVISLLSIATLIAFASATVGRGLRPLTEMADRAQEVASGDRSTRLPIAGDDPAITRLAVTVNAAFDHQQDAENRMRVFVADASHELRTPLTSASGWVDLYLQGGLTDEARRDEALQRVEAQLSRMRSLIDELALLARTDAGRPLDLQNVDLARLAEEVVVDARVVSPDRDIHLVSDSAAVVLGDPARLAQVVRNLVGNAAQHTPAGTAITVSVSAGERQHLVRVADAGPGIAATSIPHLFERFWRHDSSRARGSGGSGLGLAIVQSLVVAHGGNIAVESTPGRGSVFTVTLPSV